MTQTLRRFLIVALLVFSVIVPSGSYAAGKSQYLETQILNLLFRTQVAWKPAAICVALFTTLPSSDAGAGYVEPGGNYTRQCVTQLDANWNAPSGTPRVITNVAAITWTGVTWTGTVLGWGIFDSSTIAGGNLLYWVDSTDKTVNSGDTVQFGAGVLTAQED